MNKNLSKKEVKMLEKLTPLANKYAESRIDVVLDGVCGIYMQDLDDKLFSRGEVKKIIGRELALAYAAGFVKKNDLDESKPRLII